MDSSLTIREKFYIGLAVLGVLGFAIGSYVIEDQHRLVRSFYNRNSSQQSQESKSSGNLELSLTHENIYNPDSTNPER